MLWTGRRFRLRFWLNAHLYGRLIGHFRICDTLLITLPRMKLQMHDGNSKTKFDSPKKIYIVIFIHSNFKILFVFSLFFEIENLGKLLVK